MKTLKITSLFFISILCAVNMLAQEVKVMKVYKGDVATYTISVADIDSIKFANEEISSTPVLDENNYIIATLVNGVYNSPALNTDDYEAYKNPWAAEKTKGVKFHIIPGSSSFSTLTITVTGTTVDQIGVIRQPYTETTCGWNSFYYFEGNASSIANPMVLANGQAPMRGDDGGGCMPLPMSNGKFNFETDKDIWVDLVCNGTAVSVKIELE